jgi:hypothetical protein
VDVVLVDVVGVTHADVAAFTPPLRADWLPALSIADT